MEGKKRDRPRFFNKVFGELIDDYKNNNKSGLTFNVLKAFKRLEAAEVDPSLLAYSIILKKMNYHSSSRGRTRTSRQSWRSWSLYPDFLL